MRKMLYFLFVLLCIKNFHAQQFYFASNGKKQISIEITSNSLSKAELERIQIVDSLSNSGYKFLEQGDSYLEKSFFVKPLSVEVAKDVKTNALSEIGFINLNNKIIKLSRNYYVNTHNDSFSKICILKNGLGENQIFIPELYRDNLFNGYIVKINQRGEEKEIPIFKRKDQGWYAFWGKNYVGSPTLYHYDKQEQMMMRAHFEEGTWNNHRVMPEFLQNMQERYLANKNILYTSETENQYGEDFTIHKDSYYHLLKLKADYQQQKLWAAYNKEEQHENGPTYKTYTEAPVLAFSYPFKLICNSLDENKIVEGQGSNWNFSFEAGTDNKNLKRAKCKPEDLFTVVKGSTIEIPNMPKILHQDDLGECRAFSLHTILQKYYCDNSNPPIKDCKNPPEDLNISAFGLMNYTNSVNSNLDTFEPLQKEQISQYELLVNIKDTGVSIFLSNCKPFDNLINNLMKDGADKAVKKREIFFNYLEDLYNRKKAKTVEEISDISVDLAKISEFTGIPQNLIFLKKALIRKTYKNFLSDLFFLGCEPGFFHPNFQINAYPDNKTNVTDEDIKNRIVMGLKKGNPVLYPRSCFLGTKNEECGAGHSLVISGYRKVCNKDNICREMFKIHNSWGEEWQRENNGGWVEADHFVNNIGRAIVNGKLSPAASSVIWLERPGSK